MSTASPNSETPSTSSSARPVVVFVVAMILIFGGRLAFNGMAPKPTERVQSVSTPVNLNASDATELAQLPKLGPKKAEAIVEHRTLHGGFASPHDLQHVKGIGPITAGKVSDSARFSPHGEEPDQLIRKPVAPMPVKSGKIQPGEPSINVNQATEAELMRLPGIAAVMAQRILAEREKGPFKTIEDLRRVKGIGVKTLENLRPYIICE
jgi:competence protein ComEA